jgi:hypothetical protein
VAQRFQRCDKGPALIAALAAEVELFSEDLLLGIPGTFS